MIRFELDFLVHRPASIAQGCGIQLNFFTILVTDPNEEADIINLGGKIGTSNVYNLDSGNSKDTSKPNGVMTSNNLLTKMGVNNLKSYQDSGQKNNLNLESSFPGAFKSFPPVLFPDNSNSWRNLVGKLRMLEVVEKNLDKNIENLIQQEQILERFGLCCFG